MKHLIAFDLDGTLAESKQPLQDPMVEALTRLLSVADVAIISGGDWPQFERQIASRLLERADRTRLWLLPTTGTKLFRYDGVWRPACQSARKTDPVSASKSDPLGIGSSSCPGSP